MKSREIAQSFALRAAKAGSRMERALCLHDALAVLGLCPDAARLLGLSDGAYQAKVEACREDGEGGECFSELELEQLQLFLERVLA